MAVEQGILAIFLVTILTAVLSYLFLKAAQKTDAGTDAESKADDTQPAATSRQGRRAADRMRAGARNRRQQTPGPQDVGGELAEHDDESDEEQEEQEGKLSKKERKKARKEDKRSDKAGRRQAEIEAREAKAEKGSKYADRQRQKELEREEKEREQQEEAERKQAEQDAQDQEEFDKWKDMFSTEEGGTVEDEISQESQGLLSEFVDYIKHRKMVVLEELAAEFGLRTQDVINRIQSLESAGRLSGVMDDRGKYIYVSEEEMKNLAAYISNRGRVSIAELARKSNELIDLTAPEMVKLSDEDLKAMDEEGEETAEVASAN